MNTIPWIPFAKRWPTGRWFRKVTGLAVTWVLMCFLSPVLASQEEGWAPPGHNPARLLEDYDVETLRQGVEPQALLGYTPDNTPGLNVVLTPLKRYWMPSFGPEGDHMTSIKGLSENLPLETGDYGNLYYVSTHSRPDTLPLYRHFSSAAWDHMASNEGSVPGYLLEGLLGYPFLSAYEAMAPIMRWVKPSPMDHLTAFHEETPAGYLEEGSLGYGYPRFGENDTWGEPHYPFRLQLSYEGVALSADLSWGGMIYELWWRRKQFVNHEDPGRGIQTALFKPGLTDLQFGPTEAGDRKFHGSPVADAYVDETTLYTRTFPLQWNPEIYLSPNDPLKDHRPVLYGGEFERWARFLPYPAVRAIGYRVGYRPGESAEYMPEWVTAYLNLEVSQRFFVVTAQGVLEELPVPSQGNWVDRYTDRGAVVASSLDGSHALGIFTFSGARLLWWNFEAQNTRKLAIWEPRKTMEAGLWYHRTFFLLVGTLPEVHGAAVLLQNRGKDLAPVHLLLGLFSDIDQ